METQDTCATVLQHYTSLMMSSFATFFEGNHVSAFVLM